MEELRFDGRVAVVTGGGRGLGRAYSLLLASRGAKVVVNDPGVSRHGDGTAEGPAQEVVNEIAAAGGTAVANTDSVASPEGGQAIIDTAVKNFGRVDIVINNAGINRPALLKDVTWEEFSSVLDVHLHGAFHVTRAALPLMCDAGYGRVIMTSSIAGLYGDKKNGAYSTAKAGLIGLSNVIAIECAEHGVQSNAIVPAAVTRLSEGIDTSAFPTMTPEQVAPLVAWLVHENCTITGQTLVSLAGRMAKAFVTETRGVFQPEWSIEDVAQRMGEISDTERLEVFDTYPKGFYDHLGYSFEMTKEG
ncbi:MAG: SDR family NAD(P)-dependent oxidoreductase [Novosphingobium sp.]|nr:SDR family NAD(P)-dependent oxidoreductase [Novosphingobium sp.]